MLFTWNPAMVFGVFLFALGVGLELVGVVS